MIKPIMAVHRCLYFNYGGEQRPTPLYSPNLWLNAILGEVKPRSAKALRSRKGSENQDSRSAKNVSRHSPHFNDSCVAEVLWK